jgi:hypothetical protein
MQHLKVWLPIVISLLTLVGGSGWLKYYLETRSSRRKDWRIVLEGFLLPFQGILRHNRAVFEELTGDSDLKNLEHHPDLLQQHFASLPADDLRKIIWQKRIERLLADNRRAVELFLQNRGRIVLPTFRQACEDFQEHATRWEDLWNAVMSTRPLRPSENGPAEITGNRFPPNLEAALTAEITKVRRLAGIREPQA